MMRSFDSSSPVSRPSNIFRRIIIVLLLTLIALALAYAAYVFIAKQQGWGIVPPGGEIMLVSAAPPVAGAVVLGKSIEPFTVEGVGTAIVVDAERGTDYTYYLVANQERIESNLYRQNVSQETAGLTQLTDSRTLKFDLTYDELSGTVAYAIVGEDGATSIVAWDPASKRETVLGRGSHPTLLSGGLFVIYQRGTLIMSANTRTGEEYELLSIEEGMPFAVDPASGLLALYSSALSSLQFFTVMPKTAASFVSQTPHAHMPHALLYRDGKLTAAYLENDELALEDVEGGSVLRRSAAGLALSGYRILLHHD